MKQKIEYQHEQIMLIQEAVSRASDSLLSSLTFVKIIFETSESEASLIMKTDRIIDPVASSYFEEAKQLLLRSDPDLCLALAALQLAARLEPDCYESAYVTVCHLLFNGSRDTVIAELASIDG